MKRRLEGNSDVWILEKINRCRCDRADRPIEFGQYGNLSDELVRCSTLAKTGCPAIHACNDDGVFKNETVLLRMHRLVVDNHTETEFPNTAIALRLHNCSFTRAC